MAQCNLPNFVFPAVKSRRIEVNFDGGDVTSDGGALLLRQADRHLNLTSRVSSVFPEVRQRGKIRHPRLQMTRQRVYGIALGYEDLNDHDDLRLDPLFQTAVGRDSCLASDSTLCRFEQRSDRSAAVALSQVLVEVFVESFKTAPKELVLDFDATDDPVHGGQEKRFFHGYYDHYCFLPLYVFCGSQLLVSYLRPSNIDAAKHSWAILSLLVSLLVKRFRQEWPDVNIIFRGDSGFCRHRMLEWCNRHNVGFIVGLAKNKRLMKMCSRTRDKSAKQQGRLGGSVRNFIDLGYAAEPWKQRQRVIVKAEHNAHGPNTRFVVTNLPGKARHLYEKTYCARGDMENRIKEQKLHLFADRTSCAKWWSDQMRLLFSSLAYVLFDAMRRLALAGTRLATATCETIRLKLLKIGAVVIRNTRRIRIMLSSAYPGKDLFSLVAKRLAPG
ncbi:MAG: IS1380 family transposase [Lentisphaeria bacterium]|nr:IS1380 family transposase [Lentisphaeria bacterium]